MSKVLMFDRSRKAESEYDLYLCKAKNSDEFVLITNAKVKFHSEMFALGVYKEFKKSEIFDYGNEVYSVEWLDCSGSKSKTLVSSYQKVYPNYDAALARYTKTHNKIKVLKSKS